jgi:hypothetical protein
MWTIRLKASAAPLPSVLVSSSSDFVLQIVLQFVLQNYAPGSLGHIWTIPGRV